MKHPDPKLHLRVSIAKSIVRILAGWAIINLAFGPAGALLIFAELLGIAEELV